MKPVSVLVSFGCYNRIPQTEWLINNISHSLEASKSKIMVLADSVSES